MKGKCCLGEMYGQMYGRGTLHPYWGRKVIPPAPGHAETFGFICIEAEARRMWNTAGSGLADVVTKEAE